MTDADLPVVSPDGASDGATGSDGPTVAGVLLAAGESARFGDDNKLLATVDGEAVARRAARTLVDAGLSPLVVVVGHEADRVRDTLADLPFAAVENPDYARGQATSVRAAVEALSDPDGVAAERGGTGDVDAALFALGDMPFVDPESVRALVSVYRSGRASALAAACDGERGNPVLFDARYFDRLADVEGDVGGRELLLSGGDSALVETGDPGVRRDIDTTEDLREVDG